MRFLHLKPLLGHQVQMIALDLESAPSDEPMPKITFQQFLSQRLQRPKGIAPVTLEAMDEAIIRGALDGNI